MRIYQALVAVTFAWVAALASTNGYAIAAILIAVCGILNIIAIQESYE